MEVDILEDGELDLEDQPPRVADVVVGSVHSKLRMELAVDDVVDDPRRGVTPRGHPRRLHGPADREAPRVRLRRRLCVRGRAQYGTAVEINSRPERLDRPKELLDLALSYGCFVSIDSDVHATGQLEGLA